MKTFYKFLKEYRKIDCAIGDLARDAVADKSFPRQTKVNSGCVRNYLQRVNACQGALDTFENAWQAYKELKI